MKEIKQTNGERFSVNELNLVYIDRFVTDNYKRLCAKFSTEDDVINADSVGSIDKLNDTIVSLYSDSRMNFTSWNMAKRYMSSKFTDKAIRVVAKNSILAEKENEVLNLNE